MSLKKLHFQFKVIILTNELMYSYDVKMLREKNQAKNVSPNDKCKCCNSIPLCCILNLIDHAPIWNMSHKKVDNLPQRSKTISFKLNVCNI